MMVIADAVKGFFEGAVKPVLDKFVPDAKERLEAEQLFFKQAQALSLAQIEVNKVEAQHSDRFVSGWRPFIGWVCGASFAYAVIVRDLLNWAMGAIDPFVAPSLPVLPAPDITLMFEVLIGMLGLGGYRTFEKLRGVDK